MNTIFIFPNFTLEAPLEPLIDRDDGGHLIIHPKKRVLDRQQLSPVLAIELMRLTVVVGRAMNEVMCAHGVPLGRINYQDNGNWSVHDPQGPSLHIHLLGRAIGARIQKYGEACYFPNKVTNPGFYRDFKPLNADDISSIKERIQTLLSDPVFDDNVWRLC